MTSLPSPTEMWACADAAAWNWVSPSVADVWVCSCPRRGQSSLYAPAGGKTVSSLPPPGAKQCRCCPRRGLSGFVAQVPVPGGVADRVVLGYVSCGVAVGLHPLRGREMF